MWFGGSGVCRFKGPAFSGVFRQTDGRLVAGGDEAGVVSIAYQMFGL